MIKLEKLEKDRIFVIRGNWESREEVIRDMKKLGITLKCFPVSRRLKKGEGAGPALDIKFIPAGSTASIFKAKTKERAIELLGLRIKEDCERVNRELES